MTFFDAAWSLFMALNASSDSTDLSRYVFGQVKETEWIRESLLGLDFEGFSGRISFNQTTGRIRQNASIFLFSENGSTVKFAYYDRDQNMIFFLNNDTLYIEDTFEMDIFTVPKPLLWTMVVLVTLGFLLTLLLNIVMWVYREAHSVKASSVKLSQVAFVGCYIESLSMILVVLRHGFTDTFDKNVICQMQNLLDFFIFLGLMVLFGAICVRLWRMYRVFIHYRNPGRFLSDRSLCIIVVILVLFYLVTNIPLVTVDQLSLNPSFEVLQRNASAIRIPAILVCKQTLPFLWLFIHVFLSVILLSTIFVLAIRIRKVPIKNFRTKSIVLMSYTLSGVILFILLLHALFSAQRGKVYVMLRFYTTCVLLLCLIFIPCAMLFFPPLLPVVKEMKARYCCVYY